MCGNRGSTKNSSKVLICDNCKAGDELIRSSLFCWEKYNNAIKRGNYLGDMCSSCNGCIENYSNFGVDASSLCGTTRGGGDAVKGIITPIANCVNINCDVFYARHMARESQLEAEALLKQLSLK